MSSEEMRQEWYTNKELFERLGDLKDDFAELRSEMKETRALIKNYNGLREEIAQMREENESLKEQFQIILAKNDEKKTVIQAFRDWGGWIVAVGGFMVLLYDHFK